MKITLRRTVAAATALVLATALAACSPSAKGGSGGDGTAGTLSVAVTAPALPALDTALIGGQGMEARAYIGNSIYDGLTRWDVSSADKNPSIVPSLATEWTANDDASVWEFTLRDGVKFTDGTDWNADAAVFNFDRYLNADNEFSSEGLRGMAGLDVASIKSYEKVADNKIRLTLNGPNAHLPVDLATVYMASPAAVEKEGLEGFAKNPVGTGPFAFKSLSGDDTLTLTANKEYWRGAPKVGTLVIKPIADATARVAALQSGAVNMVSYPSPDAIKSLESSGFTVVSNMYDQIWPIAFDVKQKPWDDVRVRQAANYALDREALVSTVLGGTADPAYQVIPHNNPAYDEKNDIYHRDVAKAKQLLADAGYPDGVDVKFALPTGGSGNMIPGPMGQAIQHDLAEAGIRVTIVPLEWSVLQTASMSGEYPQGTSAMEITLFMSQESLWPLIFPSDGAINYDHYSSPEVDKLLPQVQTIVDYDERWQKYQEVSNVLTKDAIWLFVANDRNPKAYASNVKGYVPARSMFVDLTQVSVD